MKYTVVHSKDPYLLARLATDLQMSGERVECDEINLTPFNKGVKYLHTWANNPAIFSRGRKRIIPVIRLWLTTRNYIKVLTQILEP
jgi:hypothetical protein